MSAPGAKHGSAPAGADPVITGLGAITPLGLDVPTTWAALVAGQSGVGPITHFDASELPVRIAGEVKDFDGERVMGTKRFRRSARFSQFAVAAAREAVRDAGLDLAPIADRVGVIVNSTVPAWPELQDGADRMRAEGPHTVSPYLVPSTIPNMPACEVSIDLDVHGPVTASALACASGNAALLEARRLIMADEADVVIAGGTDASINLLTFAALSNMGAMSMRNDEPEKASRPFSADRDGFVFGEGSVLAVVESASHAARRGARVYGRVAGGALTADAFHISHPDPNGVQPARALSVALERARVTPAEVDYIVAHGTATAINDRVETDAIHRVFGADAGSVAVSSLKSMTGHLIAAAGALSAMGALLAMRDGVVPPTINLDQPDPDCDLDYVPNLARRMNVTTAMVNAFGFGGQNCVLVLKAA